MPTDKGNAQGTRDARENHVNLGNSGSSLLVPELIDVLNRMVTHLANIDRQTAMLAGVSEPRKKKRMTTDEKIAVAKKALDEFGYMVPTWAELADAVNIPATTLHGIKEIHDYHQKKVAEARELRHRVKSKYDAWESEDRE